MTGKKIYCEAQKSEESEKDAVTTSQLNPCDLVP